MESEAIKLLKDALEALKAIESNAEAMEEVRQAIATVEDLRGGEEEALRISDVQFAIAEILRGLYWNLVK